MIDLLLLIAAGAQADARPVAAATPEKRICRSIELTGSIMGGHRLCKTKSEWARFDQGNSESVRLMRDSVKNGYGVRRGD